MYTEKDCEPCDGSQCLIDRGVKAGGEKRPDFSVPRGRRFRDFSRKGGASADLFGKRGTTYRVA